MDSAVTGSAFCVCMFLPVIFVCHELFSCIDAGGLRLSKGFLCFSTKAKVCHVPCYDKYAILYVYELSHLFCSSPKLHNTAFYQKDRHSKHFHVLNFTLKV